MKASVLSLLVALFFCAAARSNTLSTADGITYDNISSQRVDPDGLYIEYALPGGGVGMSKVKFSRLSADQQKQFGFDAAKARDFETQVAKANEDFRQEALHDEQIARTAHRANEERNDKALDARLLAQAQMIPVQANPTDNSAPGYNYSYWGGGFPAFRGIRHYIPAQRVYAPIVTPIPFPQINTPRNTFHSGRANNRIGHL